MPSPTPWPKPVHVDIPTPDGSADAVLFRPGPGSHPGIIDLPDIGGVRAATLESSRRLAGEGFVVLAVNPFYRVLRSPFWKPGEDKLRLLPILTAPLTPEAIERDAAAVVDFLGAQEGVAPGPLGILGHCFTGGLALKYAAARPERIGAVVSFHGGGLRAEWAALVKARMYFAHASSDRSMPAESIAALETELREQGKRFESETYPAAHGWTVSDGPASDPVQAELAFGKMKSLMKDALG